VSEREREREREKLVSGDHEQIDCVVVEKLNTKLIVGLPGIDKLDLTMKNLEGW